MYLIRKPDCFAIKVIKDSFAYQMSVFIRNQDILAFILNGHKYPYRWTDLSEIVEWFQKNLYYILNIDEFPLNVAGNSAAELCQNCYDLNFEDNSKYEMLQDWMFRHSWFSARQGAYLADIYFRYVAGRVEISWDNTYTFRKEGVAYIVPKGNFHVELEVFENVIKDFIFKYKTL